MEFEFDPVKSAANKEKHGIDFVEAQALWYDLFGVEFDTGHVAEKRRVLIGRIHGVFWTAIYTPRGENIRIISVRRARIQERRRYENNQR